jgi:hypothetical protein
MNYHIIRYRDDYRIFTNNKKEGNTVIRELSKILSEMGMRLNGEKTYLAISFLAFLLMHKRFLSFIIRVFCKLLSNPFNALVKLPEFGTKI